MQAFKNTINSQGNQLKIFNQQAQAQQSEILDLFKKNPGAEYRTCDVERLTGINHDSVKRAITNLTSEGKLVRSEKAHKMGPYGKLVNTWRLA